MNPNATNNFCKTYYTGKELVFIKFPTIFFKIPANFGKIIFKFPLCLYKHVKISLHLIRSCWEFFRNFLRITSKFPKVFSKMFIEKFRKLVQFSKIFDRFFRKFFFQFLPEFSQMGSHQNSFLQFPKKILIFGKIV